VCALEGGAVLAVNGGDVDAELALTERVGRKFARLGLENHSGRTLTGHPDAVRAVVESVAETSGGSFFGMSATGV
jgi:hypothetical protein